MFRYETAARRPSPRRRFPTINRTYSTDVLYIMTFFSFDFHPLFYVTLLLTANHSFPVQTKYPLLILYIHDVPTIIII